MAQVEDTTVVLEFPLMSNVPGQSSASPYRSRLAAQADAALASATDNPLKQLLLEEKSTRQERWEQVEKAAELLLARPPVDHATVRQEEPVDMEALQRAAELGDLEALARHDPRLRDILRSDETLKKVLTDGGIDDPEATDALRLYLASFTFLRNGRLLEKEAFKAVIEDDAEALGSLLERGVRPELKNPGGQTLLELARERHKPRCEEVMLRAGATA
uniref:Uncharacterized protein n=1 Tax=Noctiluca scintillans TaxID=2966 RepID=A0A7S1FCT0_NOCSC